jgi:NitT/TauT family transport system permease protein
VLSGFDASLRWTRLPAARQPAVPEPDRPRPLGERIWNAALVAIGLVGIGVFAVHMHRTFPTREIVEVLLLGLPTLARVLVLIALASLIWVPIGVYIGLRPRLAAALQPVAQMLAAFPANLLFPLAVSAIVALNLDPDVWLSPLMVLGTQWYILFNVIAGAAAVPRDLKDASGNLGLKGWLWWRKLALPAVFPFYLTGAITASGGCWNAAIVAEWVSWGDKHLAAHGIGATIAEATGRGDMDRVVLGIVVMIVYVIAMNRLLWRPLFRLAERKYRMN